ncbi:MAG: PIG-L family deacetylase [Clostridia bacterium]|nr:PIG-L family deacetylase [Clostridia bacterium]
MLKKAVFGLFLFALLLFSAAACEDVTRMASFSGRKDYSFSNLTDRDYSTPWKSGSGSKAYLEVTLPANRPCSTVYVQWYGDAIPFRVMVEKEGEWVTLCRMDEAYYNAAMTLPSPRSRFRICPAEGDTRSMSICEIRLYSPGPLPDTVQFWKPAPEKADLMLVSAHPDDEVLWFGGALPTYAGEREMDVVVCLLVPTSARRRCEFLDCLWTCGVRTYPVWGSCPDNYSTSLKAQYSYWNENRLLKLFTSWYRRYRPDVVLTHDIRGEYGHGAHRVCADLCIRALKTAADREAYPDMALELGTWDVPKLYIHLYSEGAIEMPWDTPLDFFGGKTGLEVAREGFLCHVSQQKTHYAVNNDGRYSCTRFGLYRSLVGEDVEKNDFFENIIPGYNPFEVVEEEDE